MHNHKNPAAGETDHYARELDRLARLPREQRAALRSANHAVRTQLAWGSTPERWERGKAMLAARGLNAGALGDYRARPADAPQAVEAYDRLLDAADARAVLDGADAEILSAWAARPSHELGRARESARARREMLGWGATPDRWTRAIDALVADGHLDAARAVRLRPGFDRRDDYLAREEAEGSVIAGLLTLDRLGLLQRLPGRRDIDGLPPAGELREPPSFDGQDRPHPVPAVARYPSPDGRTRDDAFMLLPDRTGPADRAAESGWMPRASTAPAPTPAASGGNALARLAGDAMSVGPESAPPVASDGIRWAKPGAGPNASAGQWVERIPKRVVGGPVGAAATVLGILTQPWNSQVAHHDIGEEGDRRFSIVPGDLYGVVEERDPRTGEWGPTGEVGSVIYGQSGGENLIVTGPSHDKLDKAISDFRHAGAVPPDEGLIPPEVPETGRESFPADGPQRREGESFPAERQEGENEAFPGPHDAGPQILIYPDMSGELDVYLKQENRKGNEATRQHLESIRDWFLDQNPDWRHTGGGRVRNTAEEKPEHQIPGPGKAFVDDAGKMGDSRPGSKWADLTFIGPKGQEVHIQTVDVDKNGKPTARELDNAETIRRATGGSVILIPKPKRQPVKR